MPKKKEKLIDISPRLNIDNKFHMPKGYAKFMKGMKVEVGDKIRVDLGGSLLASGTVDNPQDSLLGKKRISFWSFSGWRHLEYAKPSEIIYIKKKVK